MSSALTPVKYGDYYVSKKKLYRIVDIAKGEEVDMALLEDCSSLETHWRPLDNISKMERIEPLAS